MQISSPAFEHSTEIPSHHTADGPGEFIPLEVSGVPDGAVSLVLVFDDPDIPKERRPSGLFDHWLVWNIDPAVTVIASEDHVDAVIGSNGRGEQAYVAPSPPLGDKEHRYFFKLYALDTTLDLPAGASREALLTAIQGHVIEQAELIGLYQRKG